VIQSSRGRFPGLPLGRACQLLGVNRGSYYRIRETPAPGPEGLALRAAIEAVLLAHAAYGYRRVTAQLRREGRSVNHKLVLRPTREDGLLCRPRRRLVRTTDSTHGLTVYPNLLAQAGWRQLTRVDEA
jgi:putative transposase